MNNDKTPSQLEESLIHDPNYVINLIIDNNLLEVKKRIISLGYGGFDQDITTNEDIINVVNDLIEKGDVPTLKNILSVPLLSDKIPTIYYPAIESATNKAYQRLLELGIYAGSRPNPILVQNGMSL